MDLTEEYLNQIGFQKVENNKAKKVYYRLEDNIILYENHSPWWFVQLDGWNAPMINLMQVSTAESLAQAIKGRRD